MEFFLTSLALHVLTLLATALLPVSLKTQSGETVRGELVVIESDELQLKIDGQVRSFPWDQLDWLQPQSPQAGTGPTFQVTLTGGSRIRTETVALDGETLTVAPRRQTPLAIPVRQVRAIRFRAASPALDPAWLGIIGGQNRGDTLVIRRGDDRIDPQSGVIEAIRDGNVVFDLEGDTVNAPIDRLEGVVFGGHGQIAETAEVRLTDVYGSVWMAEAIALAESQDELSVRLPELPPHRVPIDQIQSIHWTGSMLLLADEQPVTVTGVDVLMSDF